MPQPLANSYQGPTDGAARYVSQKRFLLYASAPEWALRGCLVHMAAAEAIICLQPCTAPTQMPEGSPSWPCDCTVLRASRRNQKSPAVHLRAHKKTNALFKWARPTCSNSLTRVLTHEADKGALG
jgi:hypothetical protein